MSKKLIHNYTFTPSQNKIVIDDIIRQERFLIITNVYSNTPMFIFNSDTFGMVTYSIDTVNKKTTIVLDKDCSSMNETDKLQIFVEHDGNLIQPVEAYTDPVSKLRVSNPQNLIDTDFEYGLQSTKWETIELVKNIPTFFSRDGDTGFIITAVNSTSGSKEISVTVSEEHGLTTGAPVIVIGTDLNLANGGFVVKSVPTSTTFTYMAKATATSSGSIKNSATEVFSGSIYQGTEFKLDGLDAIITDGDSTGSLAGGSTLTVKTKEATAFNTGTSFYMTNSLGAREVNFNGDSVNWIDSGDRGLSIDSSDVSLSFAFDSSLTGHRRGTGIQSYAFLGASTMAADGTYTSNQKTDPKTKFYNPENVTLDQANNKWTITDHGLVNNQAYYIEPGIGNKYGDIMGASQNDGGFGANMDSAGVGIFYARVIDDNNFALSKYSPLWRDSNADHVFTSNTITNGSQFQTQFIPCYKISHERASNDYISTYFEQYPGGGTLYTPSAAGGWFRQRANPGKIPNWLYVSGGSSDKQAAMQVTAGNDTSTNTSVGYNIHMGNTACAPWRLYNSSTSVVGGNDRRWLGRRTVSRAYYSAGNNNNYLRLELSTYSSGATDTTYQGISDLNPYLAGMEKTTHNIKWVMPVEIQSDWNTVYANNHGLKNDQAWILTNYSSTHTNTMHRLAKPRSGSGFGPHIYANAKATSTVSPFSTIANVTDNSFTMSRPYNLTGGNGSRVYYGETFGGAVDYGSNKITFSQPYATAGSSQIWNGYQRGNADTEAFKIPITGHGIPEGSALVYNRNGNTAVGGLTDLTTYYGNVVDDNNIRLGSQATIIYPAGYNKRNGIQYNENRSQLRQVYNYQNGHGLLQFRYSDMDFQDGDIVQYLYKSQPIRGLIPGAFYYIQSIWNYGFFANTYFQLHYLKHQATNRSVGSGGIDWANNNQTAHMGQVPIAGYWNNVNSLIGDFRHTSIVPLKSASSGTHILQDTTLGAADGVYSVDSSADSKTYTLKAGAKIPKRALTVTANQKVDTHNNAILYDDHGLETGTSIVYSTDGHLIGGLDSGVTYYAINSGKDHFKLAADSSNAVDETAISLTSVNPDNQLFTVASISGQSKGPGTVTIDAGKKVITGSDTLFQSKYSPGDTIKIDMDKVSETVTISSIDHTTETFTTNGNQSADWATAKPVNISFSSTYPSELNNDTIYYLGSISSNDFKLYPTDSDAVAETNVVAFSSNGSGTKEITHVRARERYKTGTIKHVNNNTSIELEEAIDSDVSGADYLVQSSFLMRADGFALHRPYDGGVELIPSTNPDGQMIRQTRRYFRYQSGKGIQNSLAINFSPPTDVDTFTTSGSTGTITTRYAHRLSDGLRTTFKGATVSGGTNLYNESYKVLSRPTDNSFTIKFDEVLTLDSNHTGLTVGETITQASTNATGLVRGDSSTVPAGNTIQLYDTEGTFHVADSAGMSSYTLSGSTSGTIYQFPKSKVTSPSSSPAGGIITYSVDAWQNSILRAGLFDDQNGLFWEYDGSTLYAVVRSSTQQLSGMASVTFGEQTVSGVNTKFSTQLAVGDKVIIKGQTYKVVEIAGDTSMVVLPSYRGSSNDNCILTKTIDTKVAQSDFNLDPADGTGPTGFVFDKTKIQMTYIDYSWYGAGKVRFGFKDQNGDVQYMHQFVHNNLFTEAYMRSGNVPGRYEIENVGTPTYVPALAHWGTSIIMDGKFDDDKAYIFTASGTNLTLTGQASATVSARAFNNTGPYSGSSASFVGYYQVKVGSRYQYLGRALEVETPSSTLNEVTAGTTITHSAGGGNIGTDSSAIAADPFYSVSSYGSALPNSGPYQPGIAVRSGDPYSPNWSEGIKNLLLIEENPSGQTVTYSDYTLGLTAAAGTPLTADYPLISIRLSPSVDTNAPGLLGEREIINRMQLALKQVGILSTHAVEVQLRMNGSIDNNDWQRVTTPSLSQLVYHTSTDTITGGNTIYSFRAQGGSGATGRTAVLTDQDIGEITFLGNSILGGDNVFPDGPDILTIVAVLAEDISSVNASNPWTVSGRVSWAESQA